jgi:predicted AAA+ superfamily ATPase
MIPRTLADELSRLSTSFPVLTMTGPRQSGKTTLVRDVFDSYTYVSLENIDTLEAAIEDPRRFLHPHQHTGLIIDEAQRAPELFSYLQGIVDESREMGKYILTGSQNFLLMEKITQSLAGRTAILHLMPFSASEIQCNGLLANALDLAMYNGFYPPIFDRPVTPPDFYPAYIQTYIERDLRSIRNIGDLGLFRKFLLLCAGRVGQLLNLTSLGNEVGVDHKTIRSWISILETSFIVFLLQPYHRNRGKRLVKQPKLYFYDTGLLSSLLGLRRASDLASHHLRGNIYECYVISEYIKEQQHLGRKPQVSFWRDHSGHEVDLIIEEGEELQAVEIKSGETLNKDFFSGLKWFAENAGPDSTRCTLVYGGQEHSNRTAARVLPWTHCHEI